LPAGSHRVIAGAKHEMLQEDDRYREELWAAFDAFMKG
jgi:lysophospholipase